MQTAQDSSGKSEGFLCDSYLKYAGWMLYDRKSAAVRLEALTQLVAIYKANAGDLQPLVAFTEGFEKRMVEMCRDSDAKVLAWEAAEAAKRRSRVADLPSTYFKGRAPAEHP